MELPTRSLVLRVCQFRHECIDKSKVNSIIFAACCQAKILIISIFFINKFYLDFFDNFKRFLPQIV